MKRILFMVLLSLITLTASAESKPMKTIANLKAGIIGETTASAKYAAFANKAREDGSYAIAQLFLAASKSEAIHAANHSKALASLGESLKQFTPAFVVKTTAENLQSAIDGETYEIITMYPKFLVDANAEDVIKATRSFNFALDIEQIHQDLYKKALAALNGNTQNTLAINYFICPVCGNIYEIGNVEEKCTYCSTGMAKFIAI